MILALKITATFTLAAIASGIAMFCWPIAVCLSRRGN
jgi:hypothetical protein